MNLKDSDDSILKAKNRLLGNYTFSNNGKWKEEFNFIVMADTQFGLTREFEVGNDDNWDIEIAYTTKCIQIINNLNPIPKFVVVCGDMINALPGTINRKNQISDFLKVFQHLLPYIPLICVCGNHDIGNTPTPQTLADYRQDFGDDYMSFWLNGVKFIAINTQFYFDKTQCEKDASDHDCWLTKELNCPENKEAKHLVVFQHIPWFIVKIDEEDQYFNIKTDIRKEMLEKLSSAGVSKVFAGHAHKNAGGWYFDGNNKNVELVVTSAVGYQLGKDEHGFRLVSVKETSITHEFMSVFID